MTTEWVETPNTYRVQGWLYADGDGCSIVAANLPGLVACGDTPAEALDDFREAAEAVLATYLDEGKPVPWMMVESPALAHLVSVTVCVEPPTTREGGPRP